MLIYVGKGEWVVLAIPYPSSALPFTLVSDASQYRVPMLAASSLSGIDRNNYYYDSSSQHLYVYLENWQEGRDIRYNHQHYESWNVQVDVQASCGSSCAGNASKCCFFRNFLSYTPNTKTHLFF